MEFTRRGPADAGGGDGDGDGRRFPDPPPHEDAMAMAVTRDALLSQLQTERLRQEIIVAELAKIERAMASGHQAAPPLTNGHAMAGAEALSEFGEEFMWPPPPRRGLIGRDHSAGVGNEHDVKVKLPAPNSEAMQGGPKPRSGKPSMDDQTEECSRPCRCEDKPAFDEPELPESNEKASPAVKWELTGITIPVKKPKSQQTWNCAVCQVKATCERNLQEHYAGQKHKSNVAALEYQDKATDQDQKAKTAAEHSPDAAPKTSLATKWSCRICQTICTTELDMKKHLGGERHQEKMRALCEEGKNMAMDSELQKAKLHPKDVPQHAEKVILIWCCNICQAHCTCELDLKKHLNGERHRAKIQELFEESKNMAKNSKSQKAKLKISNESQKAKLNPSNVPQQAEKTASSWSCSICQAHCTSESDLKKHLKGGRHRAKIQTLSKEGKNMIKNSESQKAKLHQNNVPQNGENSEKTVSRWSCSICEAHYTCESDLQNHLKGWRHRLNIQALSEEANQEKNHSPNLAKVQSPLWEWSCSLCQASCNSETQFVDHCMTRKHQQKLEALHHGESSKNSKASGQKVAVKPISEKAGKKVELYLCKACNVQCNSEKMLAHHRSGMKHADKLQQLKELGFCKVCNLQCNSEEVLMDHQKGKKHLQNMAKQKAPYFCEVCNFQCSDEKMLACHRYGKKHQAKLNAK